MYLKHKVRDLQLSRFKNRLFYFLAAMRTTGQYKSIMDLVRKLYQAEGWRVFYRGYIANSLGGKSISKYSLSNEEILQNILSKSFV